MEQNRLYSLRNLLMLCLVCSPALQTIPTLNQLCPYSSFCTSGPLKPLPDDLTPCCLPCSCSDKCSLTGNCCPDKPGITHGPPVFPCREHSSFYNKLLNRTQLPIGTHYRVIDRCSDEIANNSLDHDFRSACYEVNDLVFVSDAETNDLYLNRRCAECNGLKNVTSWRLSVSCQGEEFLRVKSQQKRDKYILEQCSLVSSLPPSYDIGLHSVCFKDQTNTCQKGEQNAYTVDLEELCHRYDYGYRFYYSVFPSYFSNIFCYMCNANELELSSISNLELCPKLSFYHRASLLSITALIGDMPEHRKETVDDECKETDVLDPFLRTCTELRCPLGHIPFYGSCIQTGLFDSLLLAVQLGIDIPVGLDSLSIDALYELLLGVKSLMLREGCELCQVRILKAYTGALVAEISISTTHTCGFMFLMKDIERTLRRNYFSIHLSDANITVPAYPLPRQQYVLVDDIMSVVVNVRTNQCGMSIYLDADVITCPTVAYKLKQLRDVGVSESTSEYLLNHSRNASNDDLSICLEKYNEIYSDTAGCIPLVFRAKYCTFLAFITFITSDI